MTRYEEEISSNLEHADTNLQQGRDLNLVHHSFDSKHPCHHVSASREAVAKQSSQAGDCFVATTAPRNDILNM